MPFLQFEAPHADETKKKDQDLNQVSENRAKKLKGGAKAQGKTELEKKKLVLDNQSTKFKGEESLELKADENEVQAEFEVMDIETAASCHKLQNGSSIRKTNESVDGTEKEDEFVELKADEDEVQAKFKEVLDLETADSCHKLLNGFCIRKTNESVDGTDKKVLHSNSFDERSQNNPKIAMVSKATEGQGEIEFVELICNEIEDEFNIPPWEIRNMKQKEVIQIAIQPEIVSY